MSIILRKILTYWLLLIQSNEGLGYGAWLRRGKGKRERGKGEEKYNTRI
jgi:hypothetical protein